MGSGDDARTAELAAQHAAFVAHVEPTRDRWGRPLIVPPDGGTARAYLRASSMGKMLSDSHALERWKLRQVARGLALADEDLMLQVAAALDDDRALDRVCEDAMRRAGSGDRAAVGSALHRLTELADRGEALEFVPRSFLADVAAWRAVSQRWRVLAAELFVVCDALEIAGSTDRVVEVDPAGALAAGLSATGWPGDGRTRFILDLKTGGKPGPVKYGADEWATQLAVYSRGTVYDVPTRTRGASLDELGVSQTHALVVHLPAGSGEATLYWIDIASGWSAAQGARWVHSWRKRKDLLAVAG